MTNEGSEMIILSVANALRHGQPLTKTQRALLADALTVVFKNEAIPMMDAVDLVIELEEAGIETESETIAQLLQAILPE